jgi:hypothetical protein
VEFLLREIGRAFNVPARAGKSLLGRFRGLSEEETTLARSSPGEFSRA